MAIWLVRAGSHGEYEQKFIQEKRVYLTWSDLSADLGQLPDREALLKLLEQTYPDAKQKARINNASQIWPFAKVMQKGDWVVLPLKTQPAIYIGEITGDYQNDPSATNPYFHWRSVKWIGEAIPRAHFSQDLLFSFGAFMTVCRIQRNNAEARLAAMRTKGWKPETAAHIATTPAPDTALDEGAATLDLEELARDQIAQVIAAKFKGHNLTRLIEAILKAQGYTTWRSPEGADGGADILAGSGPQGFASPRLCVEVKSEDGAIDRPTVDKLLGAMTKFNADQGLFVAWNGFKGNVQKELATQFFRLRLWTQKDVLEQLFDLYDRLDEDLRAELPLKRVWMVAAQGE